MEEWKVVPGYEPYEASNEGRVRNGKTGKVLKQQINSWGGYWCVKLYWNEKTPINKTAFVHRLVALAWVPNPENKPEVDHIDGSRTNARPENLRWVTPFENTHNKTTFARWLSSMKTPEKCKKASEFQKTRVGELNSSAKPIWQLTLEGEFIREWNGANEIKRELGFDASGIRWARDTVRKGRPCASKGFLWADKGTNLEKLKRLRQTVKRGNGVKGRTVLQMDLQGNVLSEFKTIREAVKQTGFPYWGISNACFGRIQTAFGFIWRYKGEEATRPTFASLRQNGQKPIVQLTFDGKFVREWKSDAEASSALGFRRGGIGKALAGKQKTAYGYRWAYTDSVPTPVQAPILEQIFPEGLPELAV